MSGLWEYFECQRCGKCCEAIGLPWDPARTEEIASFLNISVEELMERYYGRLSPDGEAWELEDHKRTPCPFLRSEGDKKACAIYPVRPEGCRLYPFETDFGRQGVDCPGADIAFEKSSQNDQTTSDEDKSFTRVGLLKLPFDEEYLAGPIAFVVLGGHSIKSIEGEEYRCLSAECRTYEELEFQIRFLRDNLDQIAEEGKKFFQKEFERREKWREGRRIKKE